MSVRARFAATVAVVIAVAVALFATVSILATDRVMRSSVHSGLVTVAQAMANTVDVHNGKLSVDASDLRELATLHAGTPFAIRAPDGTAIGGNAIPTSGQAEGLFEVTVPVARGGAVAGSVTVWQTAQWIGEYDRNAAIVAVIVGLILVGVGILVSDRVARTVLAPVERIASLAEAIEARDLSLRLDARGDDELARLCATFDRMLDRLETAFARERKFTGDASHELRAPLAVLRAETELALRRPRSDDEYRAALTTIDREAGRLETLVDELLAAARADVDASAREPVDAGEIVRRLGERLRPAAALRGVEIRTEDRGDCAVVVNEAMIERALLAIAHNAVAFAREGGRVSLDVSRSNGLVRVDVADDGAGFTADALAHATERFWRGDPARPRGGTGLGLAIARVLVEANGGRLELSNVASGGALVSAFMPASSSAASMTA